MTNHGKRWSELRDRFARVAFRRGVVRVAEEIPAAPSTVYRLLQGETRCPSRAVQASIERLVESDTEDPNS